MKFFYFAILALATLAHAEDGKVLKKRGAAGYNPFQSTASFAASAQHPVTYTKAIFQPGVEQKAASETQQQYAQQPAAYPAPAVQQYYQANAQPAQAQPGAGVQKIIYNRRPQAYSSAADVSSFSYSSPIVAYSNLGVLRPAKPQPVLQAAPSSYVPSQSAKVQYVPAPAQRVQYTAASSYPSDQNAYEPSPYQAVSQKAAYSNVPQAQGQASSYPVAPANQKFVYQVVPAYQVQAAQKAPQQVSFVPSQQFAYQPSQAAASSQAQNYETAAQTSPQVFYSQSPQRAQAQESQQQAQYYSVGAQARFADPEIVYGH